MGNKDIIFDTNYINKILNEKSKYFQVLKNFDTDYSFSVNIGTFVEVVKQRINNQSKFEEVIDLFEDYNFYIGEFRNFKCIEDPYFSFQNFKKMKKKERKVYFKSIYNNYYNFVCKFISIFLEWILYALILLVTEDLSGNEPYKKYLNNKSEKFQIEFVKSYCDKKELKIKDKFNEIVYEELKKIRHSGLKVNMDLLNSIVNDYDKADLMNIFRANNKETKSIREQFFNFFYDREIKKFIDKFNNEIFSEFIKEVLRKIIFRCGKLDGNDITDGLIVSSVNNQNCILLTSDCKIKKFLKEYQLYKEDLYKKFESQKIMKYEQSVSNS